jgi:ornithine carbamoyltransferase
MSYALKNRSLLSVDELSARDVGLLLGLAQSLKREQSDGHERQHLRGLHIALLAEAGAALPSDPSEAAAAALGARVVRVGPQDARPEAGGDVQDLARLLGRLYDGIEVRGMAQPRLQQLAAQCGVPVYRDMRENTNPARVVADLMTMQEQAAKPLAQIGLAWLGQAQGEEASALLQGALLMGLDLHIAAPRHGRAADAEFDRMLDRMGQIAHAHEARLSLHDSASSAMDGCDFCYGLDDVDDLDGLDAAVPLKPARGVPVLQGVRAVDGTDALHRAQVQNRVHAIKALLVATLA